MKPTRGRPATGTVYQEGGRWKARLSIPGQGRKVVSLPPWFTEAQAKAKALELAQLVRERGVEVTDTEAPPVEDETCDHYFDRVLEWRKGRGMSTWRDARGRWRKWVSPILGGVGIRMAKASHCEAVVRHLDAAVLAGEIEAATAIKAWAEVTFTFGQSVRSKVPGLRMREDDPTEKVAGPDRGIGKIKPVLFPDEVLRLLACEAVPLVRRRLYACAVYIGARANELLALTAADVDLDQGRIDIHKQRDRRTDGDRRTKTKRSRVPEIEPHLAPLLATMVRERPEGRLFQGHGVTVDEQRANALRADLARAGITRAELFATDDPTRLPLWFHHLRDTCLTWMAIRGDDPNRIEWRGGHTDFKTTQGYMAEGRRVGSLRVFRTVGPFPALPLAALGVLSDDADRMKGETPESAWNSRVSVATPTGLEGGFGGTCHVFPVAYGREHGRVGTHDDRSGATSVRPADIAAHCAARAWGDPDE